MESRIRKTISPQHAAIPTLVLFALLLAGCNDSGDTGAKGAQGAQGPQGVTGARGPQGLSGVQGVSGAQGPSGAQGVTGPLGPPGLASVGAAYLIPGTGGTYGGGYLTLETPNSNARLLITCNYSLVGDNEAFWFAGTGVAAGQIAITNQLDGQPLQAFNDLAINQGGQDRATVGGNPQLGAWPWHGVFIANDAGTLSRWDVTVTGSAGGNCTVVVFANNGGAATISHP